MKFCDNALYNIPRYKFLFRSGAISLINHWEGLAVVPILVLANMSLGIYYNLSIWYKLSKRTMAELPLL